MAIKKATLTKNSELTPSQKQSLKEAAGRPIVDDDENPPLTQEQLAQFHRIHEENQFDRRRQNITLRLKPSSIQKAKALGKGYSGILTRIIEDALDNPDILKMYL